MDELESQEIVESSKLYERVKKYNSYTRPVVSVLKRVDKHHGDTFNISKLALKYFTAEAYRILISENHIIFVPSNKSDPDAYPLRSYNIEGSKYTSKVFCCPKHLQNIEAGPHILKKCKYGLCINRKADFNGY